MHKKYDIEVYRRILKYPPFTPKRRPGPMRVVHRLAGGGMTISQSTETVTPEDAEVLFAIALLVQRKSAKAYYSSNEKIDVVVVETTIASIAKLLNTKNYDRIWQSIRRLKLLTIEYRFPKKMKMIMSLIHKAVWDKNNNTISVMFDRSFFEYCKTKSLTINIEVYISLNPVAKNLYSYIISNSADTFSEDTILERAVITASRKIDARIALQKALDELKEKRVIANYSTKKNGKQRVYTIERKTEALLNK